MSEPSDHSPLSPELEQDNQEKNYKQLAKQYQKENLELKKQLDAINTRDTSDHSKSYNSSISINGLEILVIRINYQNRILYINSAFCKKFKVKKDDLINQDISILKRILNENLYEVIQKPDEIKQKNSSIVHDQESGVFEVKTNSCPEHYDITIQDISDEYKFKQYVSRYVSSEIDKLSEEDLRTFKYPERRFMSLSFTDLRDFTALSEILSPEEMRMSMNAYLEEIIHAIDDNQGTVDKIIGDAVMAIYGAPKYYEDHALRAIKTCCDQMVNLKALQRMFSKQGKTIPDCGIGINTGEMVIGNIGSTTRQDYTVIGSSVNLASRLCEVAQGSQIIISEDTLKAALNCIPKDWEIVESTKSPENITLSDSTRIGESFELDDDLRDKHIAIGPDIQGHAENIQFEFQYLHAIQVKGFSEPHPIIEVIDKRKQVDSLHLDDNNVIQTSSERIFGKYRLLENIGHGGMGEVFKAKDNFGNIVAIKMLISSESNDSKQSQRFKREAEILSRLNHRSICHIYEVGEIDNTTYICMEYINGITLSELLKSDKEIIGEDDHEKSLASIISKVQNYILEEENSEGITHSHTERKYKIIPSKLSVSISIEVCEAIEYAHAHNVLHRDLKPANIMLRSDGSPVIMDFGLAKMSQDYQEEMSISISGHIMGTVDYMSPEQAESTKSVDEQTDIYSIGATLYQMICGEKHFRSTGNLIADASKLQEHSPKRPKTINPSIETDLEIITLKALRNKKEERYKSVKELRKDLQRYALGEIIDAKDVSFLEVFGKYLKKHKAMTAVVLSSLIILISTLIYSVFSVTKERNQAQNALSRLETEKENRVRIEKLAAEKFYELAKTKLSENDIESSLYNISRSEEIEPHNEKFKYLKGHIYLALGKKRKHGKSITHFLNRSKIIANTNAYTPLGKVYFKTTTRL